MCPKNNQEYISVEIGCFGMFTHVNYMYTPIFDVCCFWYMKTRTPQRPNSVKRCWLQGERTVTEEHSKDGQMVRTESKESAEKDKTVCSIYAATVQQDS